MVSVPRPTPATQPRAALYCRVSTDDQERDGTSLVTQEERCRAYATEPGSQVGPALVWRESYSGFKLHERGKLSELRAAIKAHHVDVVVCFALDRLSRNQAHTAILMEELE